MVKVAVVGGTSLLKSSLFSHLQQIVVETPHGKVIVYAPAGNDEDTAPSQNVVFLQRHHADATAGAAVYHPPHRINHRANFCALQQLQVDVVLAVCSVGSLQVDLPPGTLTIPDDYFRVAGTPYSVFDDARGHIVPLLDESVRKRIATSLANGAVPNVRSSNVVYVQTEGPRFETKAEVRFLSTLGHVVGMTAAHEATCACELKLPYAILAMVDNFGNGIGEAALTTEKFHNTVASNQKLVESAVMMVLKTLLASPR